MKPIANKLKIIREQCSHILYKSVGNTCPYMSSPILEPYYHYDENIKMVMDNIYFKSRLRPAPWRNNETIKE